MAAFALNCCIKHERCLLNIGKGILSNEKLCVLVLAVNRTSIFLPIFTRFLPPLLPHGIHFVTSCWCLVAAPAPFGVHVLLKSTEGEGGVLFLIFVMVSTSLCIFWIANTVFSGLWGLVELCVLPFGKPEFYHRLKQI